MSKYTDRQIATYEAALARWTEYETKAEPIWAEGKATPEARRLFQEYFPSPLWQDLYRELETYEQAEVKISGSPTTLWSRPRSVSSRSVTVTQCLDFGPVTLTQSGVRQESYRFPVQRTVILGRPRGSTWLIYDLQESAGQSFKRCRRQL